MNDEIEINGEIYVKKSTLSEEGGDQDYVWVAYFASASCGDNPHGIYKVPASFVSPEVDADGDYKIRSTSNYPLEWAHPRLVNKDLDALKEELRKMIDEAEVIE